MPFKTGTKHHDNKLTESDVISIRNSFDLSNNYWADKLNVHYSTISLIRSNKTWKHLL